MVNTLHAKCRLECMRFQSKKDFSSCINDPSNNFNAKSGRRLPHNFRADYEVFKDKEFETEAKTNSRHQVRLLLVRILLLACIEHAPSALFAHYTAHAHIRYQ